jgi:hypothetical protein
LWGFWDSSDVCGEFAQFEILSKRATGNCEISEQAGRTYGLYLNGQISKSEFDLRLADHFIESDRLLYCEEFKGSGFSNADKGLREDLAANMNVFRTEEGKAKRLRLTCPFEFYGNRSSGE